MTAAAVRRRYVLLTAVRWLPAGAVAPLLVLVMTERGLELAQVGYVLVPYGLVVVLLELPTGGLADGWGRRRVLVTAAAVDMVAYTAFAVARAPWAFAAAWALSGVARSLFSGPLEAWFVDACRAAAGGDPLAVRRGLAAGGSAEALALAAGAVVSGFVPPLLDGLPSGADALLVPLSGPALLAAVLAGVNGLAVGLLLRGPPRPTGPARVVRPSAARVGRPSPARLVREGAALARASGDVRRLLLAAAGVGLALVAFELYWQPRMVDLLGRPPSEVSVVLGPLLAAVFAAAALGHALGPWVARLLGGPARGAAAGCALHAVALGAAGLTRSPVAAGACFLLAYLANGSNGTLQHDLLHSRVGAEHRTVLLSAQSLAVQGGGLAAKLALVAPVAGVAGIPAAWAVAGTLLLLGGLPILWLHAPAGRSLRPRPAGLSRRSSPAATGSRCGRGG